MGCASARFHRPTSGQGLNQISEAVIKSMRSYIDRTDFLNAEANNDLLSNREAGEAYCRAIPEREYAVYFTDGGSVNIDLSAIKGTVKISWLDILHSQWKEEELHKSNENFELICPEEGHWLVLIMKN
jgi:hypothetical protein